MWTPEIEAAIEQWQRTGVFPFPSLGIYPAPAPQYFSLEDLRLIFHVAAICNEMNAIDANGFTLWTRQIPTYVACELVETLNFGMLTIHVGSSRSEPLMRMSCMPCSPFQPCTSPS